MNDFEKQVIIMLGEILKKQSEHDKRFDTMDKRFDTVENKLNAIAEQTANNTEFITTIKNDKS